MKVEFFNRLMKVYYSLDRIRLKVEFFNRLMKVYYSLDHIKKLFSDIRLKVEFFNRLIEMLDRIRKLIRITQIVD